MSKIKALILWLSIPFQKWIQRRGRRETIMTKELVDNLLSIIRPGDILLSYEAQRWTSWLIKGFYDHAAIVSRKGTVVEAVGDRFIKGVNLGGVREVSLTEWLYKKDYVAVVRVELPRYLITCAADDSLGYVGKSYDYSFSHGNEQIYCSELPYLCYRKQWPRFLIEIHEDEEILPQMYWDLCEHLDYLKPIINTKK